MTELSAVKQQLDDLSAKVDSILKNINQRIRWKEAETESGIKLQANTTVMRTGILLSVNVVPSGPGSITIFAAAKRDDGNLSIINGPFEFVDK